MTTGTLTTKNGENTLKVSWIEKYESVNSVFWNAKLNGSGDRLYLFDVGYWDFIEHKPSPAEQYKALEPGTIFVINRPDSTYKYLKISDEKYYSVSFGRVWTVTPKDFPADLYVVEEQ